MAATIYDIIQMTMVACGGTVTGKLAMQKLLYFQSQKIWEVGAEIDDHVHYYYGPFSCKVAGALLELSSFGLIHVSMTSWSNDGYVYRFSEGGEVCAKKAAEKYPATYDQISGIVERCRDVCGLRSDPMSCAAKSHYMMMEDDRAGYEADQISSVVGRFAWQVDPADARDGANLLRALELAR
ncbi:MAG: hypothetical protein MPJ78_20085 [Hyphomicrobiaceae bacterium]|nr:hypothetical protein [Hyphomicrobiaceae bacterium]